VRRGAARRARGGAGARRHLGVLLLMLKEHAEAGAVVRRCLAAAQAKCAHLGAPRGFSPLPPSLLLPLPVSLLYTPCFVLKASRPYPPPYCCLYPCPYCTLPPSS